MQAYFRKWGIYYYQFIHSEGALELHPSLGIADIIVDLTSSGTTLKDNRLREIEEGRVLESASCLIGHAPGLAALAGEGETGPLAVLLDAIDGVRASEGMLHLEVVGSPAEPGPETAAAVADYLRGQGAQHIARGEVWDDRGEPGWRVTALVAAGKLTSYERPLFRLGASRVVGLPPASSSAATATPPSTTFASGLKAVRSLDLQRAVYSPIAHKTGGKTNAKGKGKRAKGRGQRKEARGARQFDRAS